MKNLFLSLLLFAAPVFAQAPSAPVITSVANATTNTVTVTITETDPAYEIHYTVDGSVPTASSSLYVAPVVLTKSAKVQAIAVVIPATSISSADFTITPPVTSFAYNLSSSPSNLSFSYQLGAASTAAQSLRVEDSSPCPPVPPVPMCNWPVTVSTDVPWLTATSGTTGFISTVALDTTKLTTAGTFTGNVILTQPQFKTPVTKIPVTLIVNPAPIVHSVGLSWDASAGATGYNVLRGTASGGPYSKIGNVATLAYLDAAVQSGASFFYVLTAFDAAGNVSANSREVSAVIPAP